VSEEGVLRRIFGPKREEVAGGWRILHNEELHDLYASPNAVRVHQIKENEIGGACSMHGIDGKCIQNFGRKTRREETTRRT
jgi:hypothetical protein